MFPHIFLLHTLPNAHHYFPLWTQTLIVAGTDQGLKSKPYHPLCRGCSLEDESSPTVFHYPFHSVPCAADIYLQLNETLQVPNGPSTIYVLLPGFWALGVSWLQDRKTPFCIHRSQSAGLSVLSGLGAGAEAGSLEKLGCWHATRMCTCGKDSYPQRLKAGGENLLPPPPL